MNHNNHNSKMMWWMMGACLLFPIALLLGFGNNFGSATSWQGPILIGLFVAVHIAMMVRGRDHAKRTEQQESNTTPQPSPPTSLERHTHGSS